MSPIAKIASLMVLAQLSTAALADRGVIVDHIPRAIDGTTALSEVKKVFSSIGWVLTGSDETSVSAKYDDKSIEARVRIFIEDGSLRYEESATDLAASRQGRIPETRTPARWINRLRTDMGRALRLRAAGIPEPRMPPPAPRRESPVDRMTELRKMRDSGLVTQEEYDQKRAEILKDL